MPWGIDVTLSQIQMIVTQYGLKILAAIVILILGRLAAGLVRKLIGTTATRAKADQTVASFLKNMAYIGVMTFAAIAALGRLGVETASFIAVIGAAAFAIGLAFQGSLSNFAAGFLVVIFKPFKVVDYIEGAGVAGTVREIHVFTTTLITPDNKRVTVPNSKLTSDNIINYTAEPIRRVDMSIGVSYSDDLDKVKQVLLNVVPTFPGVLPDPEPQIAVAAMADSSVNFVVRPWVNTSDYWNVFFGLTETIKKQFDAEGISIPFPQQDIHFYQHLPVTSANSDTLAVSGSTES